jgi:hypothetical protein
VVGNDRQTDPPLGYGSKKTLTGAKSGRLAIQATASSSRCPGLTSRMLHFIGQALLGWHRTHGSILDGKAGMRYQHA